MPYHTIPYYTVLYYTILYYTIRYYTILCYIILYHTIPYHTILYYTILYYTTVSYLKNWTAPFCPAPRFRSKFVLPPFWNRLFFYLELPGMRPTTKLPIRGCTVAVRKPRKNMEGSVARAKKGSVHVRSHSRIDFRNNQIVQEATEKLDRATEKIVWLHPIDRNSEQPNCPRAFLCWG